MANQLWSDERIWDVYTNHSGRTYVGYGFLDVVTRDCAVTYTKIVRNQLQERIAELETANKRLTEEIETKNMHIGAISALLPSAEVQRALLKMTIIVDQTSTGELEIDPRKVVKSNLLEEIKLCYAWLDSLESERAE